MEDENFKNSGFRHGRGSTGLGHTINNFNTAPKALPGTQFKLTSNTPQLRGLHLSLGGTDKKSMPEKSETKTSMAVSFSQSQRASTLVAQKSYRRILFKPVCAFRKAFIYKFCDKSRNRKGFAILQILIFLPVLVVLIVSGGGLQSLITKKSRQLHHCRLAVLKIQSELSKELQSLLSLNKKALKLRQQKIKAHQKLKIALMAGNAAAIAACRMEIAYINSVQLILDTHQKQILAQANSIYEHWRLKNKAARRSKALSIHPDQSGIAPVYKTDMNFTQSQKIHLLKPVVCAASLSFKNNLTGGQKCFAHLVAAKSS